MDAAPEREVDQQQRGHIGASAARHGVLELMSADDRDLGRRSADDHLRLRRGFAEPVRRHDTTTVPLHEASGRLGVASGDEQLTQAVPDELLGRALTHRARADQQHSSRLRRGVASILHASVESVRRRLVTLRHATAARAHAATSGYR
jgi:hypothetical protein